MVPVRTAADAVEAAMNAGAGKTANTYGFVAPPLDDDAEAWRAYVAAEVAVAEGQGAETAGRDGVVVSRGASRATVAALHRAPATMIPVLITVVPPLLFLVVVSRGAARVIVAALLRAPGSTIPVLVTVASPLLVVVLRGAA